MIDEGIDRRRSNPRHRASRESRSNLKRGGYRYLPVYASVTKGKGSFARDYPLKLHKKVKGNRDPVGSPWRRSLPFNSSHLLVFDLGEGGVIAFVQCFQPAVIQRFYWRSPQIGRVRQVYEILLCRDTHQQLRLSFHFIYIPLPPLPLILVARPPLCVRFSVP